jgi:hypothetical protein
MLERGWPTFADRFGPDAYMALNYVGQVYPWNSAPGASPQLEASSANRKRTNSARCAVEEARPLGMTRQGSATLCTGCTRPAGG